MPVFDPELFADKKSRLLSSNAYINMLQEMRFETEEFYHNLQPTVDFCTQAALLDRDSPTHDDDLFRLVEDCYTFEALMPVIDFEIEKHLSHPLYASPKTALNSGAITGWVLHNQPEYVVMLTVFNATEFRSQKKRGKVVTSINFPAGDIFWKILKSDGLTCSRWKAPFIDDETHVTSNMKCELVSTQTYKSGDHIVVRGGSETILYDDVTDLTVALQVYSRRYRTNVMADYDLQTHQLRSLSAADQRSSRLQILGTLMRIFDRQDALPAMQDLLDHPDHYVRWQAAREMMAISPLESEKHIVRLSEEDRNPLVRQAAVKSLQLFFKQDAA